MDIIVAGPCRRSVMTHRRIPDNVVIAAEIVAISAAPSCVSIKLS